MRFAIPLSGLLTVLVLAAPGAAPGGPPGTAVAHEEMGRALDDLAGRLHDLGMRWREHFGPGHATAERPLISLMLHYRSELALSAQQVDRLEQIRTDFQREALRRDGEVRAAERALADLLRADPVDLGRVEERVREIERLRADLRLARIRAIEDGKAQLTADQRATLESLLGPPRLRRGVSGSPAGRAS